MQLSGEDRVGDRRVLDEDHREPGADGEVSAESLVVVEVTGDPDAAVEEQDDREGAPRPFGPLNVERDGLTVDDHILLLDGDSGEVARSARLESGEGGTHLASGQQPERGRVFVGLGEKSPDGWVNPWVGSGVGNLVLSHDHASGCGGRECPMGTPAAHTLPPPRSAHQTADFLVARRAG